MLNNILIYVIFLFNWDCVDTNNRFETQYFGAKKIKIEKKICIEL